jgi:hypothetical protein
MPARDGEEALDLYKREGRKRNVQDPRRKRLQLMDSVDSDVDGWNSAFLAP